MSTYFNINGMKVRVSDHEPNFAMDRFRGANDIELYTRSVDNRELDVQSQIISLFDKGRISESDLLEMYNNKLAKRATLKEIGISIPKKKRNPKFRDGVIFLDRVITAKSRSQHQQLEALRDEAMAYMHGLADRNGEKVDLYYPNSLQNEINNKYLQEYTRYLDEKLSK